MATATHESANTNKKSRKHVLGGNRIHIQAAAYRNETLTALRLLTLNRVIREASVELALLEKLTLATQFASQRGDAKQSDTKQRNCRAAIGNRESARSGLDDAFGFDRLDKTERGNRRGDE